MSARNARPRLSHLENTVMELVWTRAPLTAEAVRDHFGDSLQNAVQIVLLADLLGEARERFQPARGAVAPLRQTKLIFKALPNRVS